jgi:hypothetical protein
MEDGMNNKLRSCLVAGAIGATLALSPSALARGGGGGGFGGHAGGMGGGMHAMGGGMGGGTHFGAMSAGPRFGGVGQHFAAPRFAGGPFAAHAAFSPRFSHFAIRDGFHHRFFHHRFHRFAFFGAPFVYASYDTCWRRVWTQYGLQLVNVCGDYGY